MPKVLLVVVLVFAAGCASDPLGPAGCRKDADCKEGHVCIDKRCQLECSTAADCDDGNLCTDEVCDPNQGCVHTNNTELCDDDNPCTDGDICMAGACESGTPRFDGAECDRDGMSETRDICLLVECVPSICGDGYVDEGLDPPEECDDGNLVNGDGCENDCSIVPPDLAIIFPERGATLTGDATVTVTGTAGDDALGLASLTINGEAVTLANDGTFSHSMTAMHGLNFVEAIAINNGGKRTRRTVGYYHAAAYAAYSEVESESARLADGLVMRVSQEAIDDGDHPCTYDASGYACTEVDDIATLGEIVLNNLDLSATLGSIPIYQSTTNFLDQRYTFASGDLIVDGLTVGGDIVVTGDVIITVSIVDLDFNSMALALTSKNGGVDADVAIDAQAGNPGFGMAILTTVEIPVIAAFDPETVSLSYETEDLSSVVCFLLENLGGWDLGVVCPDASGQVDPIASLTQEPPSSVSSTMSIERMRMVSTFLVNTAPGGGVEVDLVGGLVTFHNSEIDIQPVAEMTVNLGTIDVLGAEVDLGTVDVGNVAANLNDVLSGILSAFTNDLQPLLEVAIAAALFHPDDPLTVGNLLKAVIEQVAPNGPVALEPFGGQAEVPALAIGSAITSIELTEAVGPLTSGGMTPGLDVLYSAPKQVERDPLGSVLSPGCYGDPEPEVVFAESSILEMAEHVDVINQGLFAVWWNGGFDFAFADEHLAAISELSGEAFDFNFAYYTAPILSRCDHDLTLEAADIHITGSFGAGTARTPFEAFASISMPVDLTVADQSLTLARVAGTPFFAIEVVSTADPAWSDDLEALLEQALTGDILFPYASHVVDSMPTFRIDLSALSVDADAAVLRFLPESTSSLGGYEMLSGSAGQ